MSRSDNISDAGKYRLVFHSFPSGKEEAHCWTDHANTQCNHNAVLQDLWLTGTKEADQQIHRCTAKFELLATFRRNNKSINSAFSKRFIRHKASTDYFILLLKDLTFLFDDQGSNHSMAENFNIEVHEF